MKKVKVIPLCMLCILMILNINNKKINKIEKTNKKSYKENTHKKIENKKPEIQIEEEQEQVEEIPIIDEVIEEEPVIEEQQEQVQDENELEVYKITHYGPNCNNGACSGITASGYDVRNTIYYNDQEYGQLRIVATSRDIPLNTIIKIKDYKVGGDTLAIVLDRGVSGNVIDLLVNSENEAIDLGIQYTNIEIVREG